MFRYIAFVLLVMTIGWLIIALRSQGTGFKSLGNRLVNSGKILAASIRKIFEITPSEFSVKILFPATVFSVLILAFTGFVPSVLFGLHLSGYLLVLHMIIAPIFGLCMAMWALIWTKKYVMSEKDWLSVWNSLKTKTNLSKELVQKLLYWLLVCLSMIVIFSMLISMFPIYGTNIQEMLLKIHQFSTLFFFILFIFFTFLIKLYKVEK